MPQTSTRNLFAMLPVNPLEPPSRTRTDASAAFRPYHRQLGNYRCGLARAEKNNDKSKRRSLSALGMTIIFVVAGKSPAKRKLRPLFSSPLVPRS